MTLSGPGGVGKTRLALELAAQLQPAYGDGATFVPLAQVADPSGVTTALARGLGLREPAVREGGGHDSAGALVDYLQPLHLLLVLDNFEQLLPAGPVVAQLLSGCPRLTVVVTSRAPLRLRGEQEYAVSPLQVPAADDTSAAAVAASAAGELFVACARSAMPSFALTGRSAAAVSAICHRLAGLPLALELAAANVRALSPEQLLSRLDQALDTSWSRDLPERQRGLRATLDWSYQLLDPDPQTLFRRLACFAGGFTLDAAEAVAAPAISAGDVLPALVQLVEHSLVAATPDADGDPRYQLLEPIRQCADSLLDDEERADTMRGHARHFLQLVETAAPALQTGEQVLALAQLDREDANIRRAIAWSLGSGDAETAARMCWSMWLAWWLHGGDLQAGEWVEEVLRHDLTPAARSGAAMAAACLAYIGNDYEIAEARWSEGADCAREAGDPGMQANGVAGVGLVAMATADFPRAEAQLRAALALAEQVPAERLDADWLRSLLLVWLGTITLVSGDPAAATPLVESGLELARRRGDRLVTYIALFNLAQAATAQGDLRRAEDLLRQGVQLSQETGDRPNTSHFLEALAVCEGQAGRWEQAALLAGAAEGVRASVLGSGYNYYLPDTELRDRTMAQARAVLGGEFDDVARRGRELSLDQVVALVTR